VLEEQCEPVGQGLPPGRADPHSMRSQRSLSGLQTVSWGQSAIRQPPPSAYAPAATAVTPTTTAGFSEWGSAGFTLEREPVQPASIQANKNGATARTITL
jgi:hypothetical protein